jgi:hypothetical protein
MIYHNVNDLAKHLTFESEKWKPLVEKAFNEGKTTLKGWGNGVILIPESESFNYQSFSYDMFGSVQDALSPEFSDDLVIPDGFFEPLAGNYAGPRNSHLYRVVAAVAAPPE